MTKWVLFLDDYRKVADVKYPYEIAAKYFYSYQYDVAICTSYEQAVNAVKVMGVPSFISFDHDLADEHYGADTGERTGYSFAKWFVNYLIDNNITLTEFDFYVHSMNPVGAENIKQYMKSYLESV